jgi:hypothetical protein
MLTLLKYTLFLVLAIAASAIAYTAHQTSKSEAEQQYLTELAEQHQDFPVLGTIVDIQPIMRKAKVRSASNKNVIESTAIAGTILVLDNDTAIGIDAHIDFVSPGLVLKLAPEDEHDARAYCIVGKFATCSREVEITSI